MLLCTCAVSFIRVTFWRWTDRDDFSGGSLELEASIPIVTSVLYGATLLSSWTYKVTRIINAVIVTSRASSFCNKSSMHIAHCTATTATAILMARMFPSSDPCLPHYKSLLVQGDYHPSAPIHICLSVPADSKALLLSSSRKALIHSLREYNSEWLHTKSGTGNACQGSSKVDILLVPIFPCGRG
jgi:hypothetical protein